MIMINLRLEHILIANKALALLSTQHLVVLLQCHVVPAKLAVQPTTRLAVTLPTVRACLLPVMNTEVHQRLFVFAYSATL